MTATNTPTDHQAQDEQETMKQVPMQLPSTGFVRLPVVLSVFPVSRSSWYRGIKKGKYPAPVKIGEHSSAWAVQDLFALFERLKNQGMQG